MLDYFDNIRRRTLTRAELTAALSACESESVLLNSERIEQHFGSCGIDILASEPGLRRSSLYSIEDGEPVCRTYAIVRFTDDPDRSYHPEHTMVLAGNSLGAVFKSSGWAIHKQTLHIGSIEIGNAESEIIQLMKLDGGDSLALHIFEMLLAKNDQAFEYATIIKAHHPAYLSKTDLLDIYEYDAVVGLSDASIAELVELIKST